MALSTHSDGTEGSESADDGYRHHQMPVEDIKEEWRLLWLSRIDDKVRAEGIANRDYSLLFVEQGTVIVATRDFKPVSLKEILFLHKIRDVERVIPPRPSVGGWGKFARTVLNKQKRVRKYKKPVPRRNRRKNLQVKKGGRGWLHYRMEK